MKKGKKIGACLLTAGLLAALATACSSQPGDSTANSAPLVQTEPAKAPSDSGDKVVTGGDLAFINDAVPGGMAEVELGRLAVKQAASKDVKQFAERMIADHTKAGDELKQLAGRKKVPSPPSELLPKQKETLAKLTKLQGAAFDSAYVQEMVADHEKDVAAFDNAAKTGTDADVKAYAAKTLPTLKEHLRMIQELATKMGGKAKP